MKPLALVVLLIALTGWVGCAPSIRPYRLEGTAAQADRAPRRGDLVAMEPLEQKSQAALQAVAQTFPGRPGARTGAQLYRLTYWTEIRGERVVASGLVSIPIDTPRFKGVVLYAHGTTMTRALSPSEPDRADGLEETAIFTGNGYIVAVPDYIGLGRSHLPQAYSIVRPQVDASVDMLRALRTWTNREAMPWSPSLMLMGFSQGGQTVAGLHRELERTPLDSYCLRGAVAVSGAHDLRGLTAGKLEAPAALELANVGYVAFAVSAYAQYYGAPLEDSLAAPYAGTLPALFDGSLSIAEIAEQLPGDARSLFRPDALSALLADKDTWFTRALDENETFAWIPRAPLRIVYGDADMDVPAASSRALHDFAAPKGGAVTLHPMGPVDHMATGARAYAPTLAWFDTLVAPESVMDPQPNADREADTPCKNSLHDERREDTHSSSDINVRTAAALPKAHP